MPGEGWSCQQVAHALLLDDDTIRSWRKLFEQRGIEGITSFDVGGKANAIEFPSPAPGSAGVTPDTFEYASLSRYDALS